MGTLIKNPKKSLLKIAPHATTPWTNRSRVTVAEFFEAYQEANKALMDANVQATANTMTMISERTSAENSMLKDAVNYLNERSSNLQSQVAMLLLEREEHQNAEDPMDLDVPEPPPIPDYLKLLQDALVSGKLHISAVEDTPQGRARSNSAFPTDVFPLPIMPPPQPATPQQPTAPTTSQAPPPIGGTPAPARFSLGLGGPSHTPIPPPRNPAGLSGLGGSRHFPGPSDTPTPVPDSFDGHSGYTPPPDNPQEPPPAGQQREERGRERERREGQERRDVRGSGGNGGRGGGRGRAGAGDDDPGSSSSDSEPQGADPRDWRRHYRRRLKRQERATNDQLNTFMEQMKATFGTAGSRNREPKAPQPTKFKGEAHDVDRFLRQCENVFILEASSFREDNTKIRYTGNLLEGNRPVNWYEAYHNLIDQGAADRAAGNPVDPVRLDPHWNNWNTFTNSFRSSFGDRVTREEAVEKWNRLSQTAGIDTFLDQIVQLMWRTGYTGEVVDDKISQNLNADLALDWAKVLVKPASLHERIQLLRSMGHVLERHKKMRASGTETEKRGGEKKRAKRKGQSTTADTAQKTAGDNQSSEKKDKAVELKGMSEYYLAL